jgi:hypothetical protein
MRAGAWQRHETSLEAGECNYYSKQQVNVFITVRDTSIDVRDSRTRAVIKTLDCAGARLWFSKLSPTEERNPRHEYVGIAHDRVVMKLDPVDDKFGDKGMNLCVWDFKANKTAKIRELPKATEVRIIDDKIIHAPRFFAEIHDISPDKHVSILEVLDLHTLKLEKQIPFPPTGSKNEERSVFGQDGMVVVTIMDEDFPGVRVFNLQTLKLEESLPQYIDCTSLVRTARGWAIKNKESFVLELRDRLRFAEKPVDFIKTPISLDTNCSNLISFGNTVLHCSAQAVDCFDLVTKARRRLASAATNFEFSNFQFFDGVLTIEEKNSIKLKLIRIDFNQTPPEQILIPPKAGPVAHFIFPVLAEESGCLQSMLNCLMECLSAFCSWISQFFRACFSLN